MSMFRIGICLIAMLLAGCNGGTKQALRNRQDRGGVESSYSQPTHARFTNSGRNSIRMTRKNGVYTIPVKINNHEMEFILDTGASDILLSSLEAIFLIKQGSLTEDDIIGQEAYSMANGSIEVGTVVNLRQVQIGSKIIYNVRATVVDNIAAPLLCGQSALARFGKITINYDAGILEFY